MQMDFWYARRETESGDVRTSKNSDGVNDHDYKEIDYEPFRKYRMPDKEPKASVDGGSGANGCRTLVERMWRRKDR